MAERTRLINGNSSHLAPDVAAYFKVPDRNLLTAGEPVTSPTTEKAHRWKLEDPNGPQSQGVCEHCGAKRLFDNFIPHITDWEKESRESYRANLGNRDLLSGTRTIRGGVEDFE